MRRTCRAAVAKRVRNARFTLRSEAHVRDNLVLLESGFGTLQILLRSGTNSGAADCGPPMEI